MIVSGIFVNGPYGLITTAVSANLVSKTHHIESFIIVVWIGCSWDKIYGKGQIRPDEFS